MRKHRNSSISKRRESRSQRIDVILSGEKNKPTMRIPNARTSAMTAAVPKALATRHHSVPSQKPNA